MADIAEVDAALHKLGESSSAEVRTEAFKALVEYWHGPIRPSDGFPQSELAHLQIPRALRWWYSWAGRRKEITCGQDVLLQPDELTLADEGRLVQFWVENQGIYARATLPTGDDPSVFQSDWNHEGRWQQEERSVLEFLIQVCVHEAITNATYTGYLDVEECQLEQFSRIVPRLRIAPWRPWLQGQGGADTWGYKDFYVGRGILAETNDLGCSPAGIRGYTLSVAGKARGTLAQLNCVIKPEEWEHTTF